MTLNRRQFLVGSSTAGALSILLAACGNGATSTSKAASGSSSDTTTLVEAVAGLPTGFSFDTAPSGYENMEFNNNVQACLIRNPYVTSSRDAKALTQDNYKFEGVLAESYDVSSDGLEYTFKLRQGVLSQQGNPFTADDVLFSYQRKWHSTSITPFVSSPAITDPSKQFTKVDDNTVKITVDRKSDGFTLLALLANVTAEIYDSTYLKKYATKSDPYGLTISNTKANFGYGAYMLDSYTPGQQMILVANPHFALGEPKIKKVIQRVVADGGTRANILQQGAVDIAVQLRPEDVASFAEQLQPADLQGGHQRLRVADAADVQAALQRRPGPAGVPDGRPVSSRSSATSTRAARTDAGLARPGRARLQQARAVLPGLQRGQGQGAAQPGRPQLGRLHDPDQQRGPRPGGGRGADPQLRLGGRLQRHHQPAARRHGVGQPVGRELRGGDHPGHGHQPVPAV